MNHLLLVRGGAKVFASTAESTPKEVLESWGATEGDSWAVFNHEDFDPEAYSFATAWSINDDQVIFDFDEAKRHSADVAKGQSSEAQKGLLDGFTAEQIAAQVAVSAERRDARVQHVLDALNAETQRLMIQLDAIHAAKTATQLKEALK